MNNSTESTTDAIRTLINRARASILRTWDNRNAYSEAAYITEFTSLALNLPRQIGKTTAIVNNFVPGRDLIIVPNSAIKRDVQVRLLERWNSVIKNECFQNTNMNSFWAEVIADNEFKKHILFTVMTVAEAFGSANRGFWSDYIRTMNTRHDEALRIENESGGFVNPVAHEYSFPVIYMDDIIVSSLKDYYEEIADVRSRFLSSDVKSLWAWIGTNVVA